MIINYNYRENLKLSNEEQEFLSITSQKYGNVEIRRYFSKSSVLDFNSIIETTLTFIALTNLNAFSKGLIGEDWFKHLGEKTREELKMEILNAKTFIKAYFEVFVKGKENKQRAFIISELIGDVTLYVVINHYNITEELLEKLSYAMVDTYGRISLKQINIESKTCQLYPDFEENEWRYLFTPTSNGFGNYVDQYFDFKTNQMIKIGKKSDFFKKFPLVDEDRYKLIINTLSEK